MRSIEAATARTRQRSWLGGAALVLGLALALPSTSAAAVAVAVSPLNGTPDASPYTQISFLGVPSNEISHISVVGSRTGSHSGRLEGYVTAPGASFVLAHQLAQGERVAVSAVVGPKGHTQQVGSTFYVARLSGYTPPAASRPAPAKAGTVQSFLSQPTLHPPKVAITTNSPAASPGDVFLTPTHGLGQSGPMIVNGQGGLVWYLPLPTGDVAANFQVETYQGQPVLVWWQGHIPPTLGVGFGTDVIYNAAYQHIASVSAGNGYQADLHELQITPQGSAFITAYSLVDADLSSVGGSRDGTLQDALLQEIDIPTGLVMFEWHAYGHVELDDSYSHTPYSSSSPWDFFHMNSISMDTWGDGNFIVSSRNTWAAYEINHVSGNVMWRIGGKRSSFKMGAGTGTAYQHDVRWQPDHTLTVFDNGAVPKAHSQSRVIRERIDGAHHKVTLVSRYVRTPGLLTGSQGDDQVLGNGNSFVGWGEAPYFTEFSPTGQIIFDGHIPSPGQSYRAFRFPWSATPAAPPSVAVKAKSGTVTVYASWNGATNVSSWRVIGGGSPVGLTPIATVPVAGFETVITVHSTDRYYAVQALDASGQVLGSSAVR
ncbi:MAG: arylsulfotransferase family protein [Solirubrobacteraceae bacterium]